MIFNVDAQWIVGSQIEPVWVKLQGFFLWALEALDQMGLVILVILPRSEANSGHRSDSCTFLHGKGCSFEGTVKSVSRKPLAALEITTG